LNRNPRDKDLVFMVNSPYMAALSPPVLRGVGHLRVFALEALSQHR
jgi:hypothetical protein